VEAFVTDRFRHRRRAAGGSLLTLGLILTVLGLFPGTAGADHNPADGPAVTPEFIAHTTDSNPTCSEYEGAGQTWNELKIDPNANGVYPDTDGTPGPLIVTITNNAADDKSFDWSANLGVDAVLVKAGAGGHNLYRYDPPAELQHDDGLRSPEASGNGISHISVCYDVDPPVDDTTTTTEGTTTTTTEQVTTTTVLSPTTTATPTTVLAPVVLGEQITTTTVKVLGVQETRALAATGDSTRPLLLVAGFLLALGGAALLAGRQPQAAFAGEGMRAPALARLLTLARMTLTIEGHHHRPRS
jgi:hypothetical protein